MNIETKTSYEIKEIASNNNCEPIRCSHIGKLCADCKENQWLSITDLINWLTEKRRLIATYDTQFIEDDKEYAKAEQLDEFLREIARQFP